MPFTVNQFFDIFGHYNAAVFPVQVLLNLAAIAVFYFSVRPNADRGRHVSLLLALLWLWTGVAYHLVFFSRINNLAFLFGALFIFQACSFLYFGVWKGKLHFRVCSDRSGMVGLIAVVYALFLYPMFGALSGHIYPNSPTFGTPCPLTIFTFGVLFWAREGVPAPVIVIPLLWAVVGTSAAFLFGVYEDLALIAMALLSMAFLWPGRWKYDLNKTPEAIGDPRQEQHI